MIFSSIIFLFYFLPIILLIYYIAPTKYKNFIFLIASLFFYSWGEPLYIFLLLISLIINYSLCKNFDKVKYKKFLFILSILLNILILGIFKYTNFIIDTINQIFNFNIVVKNIPLPLGISFFTFQALSYVIDVYRGNAKPQKSLSKLCLYIFAFPQLVAGPIVRYTTIMEQIDKRHHSLDKFSSGIIRFSIGISKKVLISNPLGLLTDNVFVILSQGESISFATAWIAIISYTIQIYFDFSGYSDMAIGLGKMFGFEFTENFNYPYISKSVAEFWRRWHISLGSWFKDYIYIPLGGNRCSNLKWIRNLLIVWFLTGLWHGASFNFIIWGLYYAVFLMLEKYLKKLMDKVPNFLLHIYTMFAVIIGWVFFRASNLNQAFYFISILIGINNNEFYDSYANLIFSDNWHLILIGILFSTNIFKILYERYFIIRKVTKICIPVILPILVCLSVLSLVNSTYNPFIYFRF